jgi:hypothetical protein
MGGCCLLALLFLLGPRIVLILIWLFTNWYDAFSGSPLLVPLLGWLFLPYTSMAWMFIYFQNDGQLGGGYLVLLILAVLFDIGVFSGSHRARRTRRRE